jgi:nitrogen fixation/metabolism regulation signal transduction histidine kinase
MVAVLLAAGFAFAIGLIIMRRMRRSIVEEGSFESGRPGAESFPLHTYHAVIQQLKQQKHELQSQQQEERRRSKTSENISTTVLSNLSCGVLFFTTNGLVRQGNASARQILGFSTLTGLRAAEIFRDTALTGSSGGPRTTVAAVVDSSLREKRPLQRLDAEYLTPAGEKRVLEITVNSVHAPDGEVLGATCLVDDRTEVARIRRQEELRGEVSAEMALTLRSSLATISGYAQQLAASRDSDLVKQLAIDIASEAASLDRTIGRFLAEATAGRSAATA